MLELNTMRDPYLLLSRPLNANRNEQSVVAIVLCQSEASAQSTTGAI